MESTNEDLGLNRSCGRGGVHIHEPFRLAGWRSAGSEARRNKAVLITQICCGNAECNRAGSTTVNHRRAVKRVDSDALENFGCRAGAGKFVYRHVISIRPPSELRIVARSEEHRVGKES